MVTDSFANNAPTADGPSSSYETITPNDTTDLATLPRALYIGTGGDVTVINPAGGTVTFKSVPAGSVLPIRFARLKATATTANNFVALY